MIQVKSQMVAGVRVCKYYVDWSDLARETAIRLDVAQKQGHTGYYNPEYSVEFGRREVNKFFIKQARRAQVLWLKRVVRVLGLGGKRRAFRSCSNLDRQLQFTGVLLVEGQFVDPKRWPAVE